MKKHILVVDDDPGILDAVEILLEELGFKVTILKEALELQQTLKTVHPDLVLLDLLLSGADGRDLCRGLKSNESTKHIPVILMSADTHIKEKSQTARADAYLKKPFDIDEIESLLHSFLERKNAQN